MRNKIIKFSLLGIIIFSVIGLIITPFFELNLANKIGDENNLFGIIMSGIGIVPSLSVGVFASTILFFCPQQITKLRTILVKIAGIVGFILINYFEISESIKYADFPRLAGEKSTYVALLVTLIVLIDLAIIMFAKTKVKYKNENTVRICFTIVLTIAFISGFTEVIKHLASRPRPYSVQSEVECFKNWFEFRPFYLFKNKDNNNTSFVSGHTANSASLIFSVPLLISLTNKNSAKISIASISIGFLFTLVLGISRVIVNAHFLSDVFGAFLLSSLMSFLGLYVSPKIYEILK